MLHSQGYIAPIAELAYVYNTLRGSDIATDVSFMHGRSQPCVQKKIPWSQQSATSKI